MTTVLDKPKPLDDSFTSNGSKHYWHQEKMALLRNGVGRPICTTILITDVCQHSCAFCSVLTRTGNTLSMDVIRGYLDQLCPLDLKAVVLSGAGNPILYRDKETGDGFNDVVDEITRRGLDCALITNGMPLRRYDDGRLSWRNVKPSTLDKLTWVRVSLAGLDHKEQESFIPDVDPAKTYLGMSYVAHDIFKAPEEPNHGKVSTIDDLIRFGADPATKPWTFEERIPWLTDKLGEYVNKYKPVYLRILPNCLQPERITDRCAQLQEIANAIDPTRVFVQNKMPRNTAHCYNGYPSPCLNTDGFVYPCTSVVLNPDADHKFAEPWRMCRWDEIGELYSQPVRSLIDDPATRCPSCVFYSVLRTLEHAVDGTGEIVPPLQEPIHPNFV